MKPHEFAELAGRLAKEQELDGEALYRTIIGRYYYSAYHEVKLWLETCFTDDYHMTEGNSHERLSNCCFYLQRKHMDLGFSSLGRMIEWLKNRRVKADYELNKSCSMVDVELMQKEFENFIKKFDELKNKYH